MDLCTESSYLSESVTLDHLKEDLNLVTDEDLTDLLKRECNEPEDTANVRCAQIITVLSNNISKISLLILKAMIACSCAKTKTKTIPKLKVFVRSR